MLIFFCTPSTAGHEICGHNYINALHSRADSQDDSCRYRVKPSFRKKHQNRADTDCCLTQPTTASITSRKYLKRSAVETTLRKYIAEVKSIPMSRRSLAQLQVLSPLNFTLSVCFQHSANSRNVYHFEFHHHKVTCLQGFQTQNVLFSSTGCQQHSMQKKQGKNPSVVWDQVVNIVKNADIRKQMEDANRKRKRGREG
jgi:hypothetical protein